MNFRKWNDGYWPEGLDRTNTVLILIHEILRDHPSIVKADMEGVLDEVVNKLAYIYESIATAEDIDNENKNGTISEPLNM